MNSLNFNLQKAKKAHILIMQSTHSREMSKIFFNLKMTQCFVSSNKLF